MNFDKLDLSDTETELIYTGNTLYSGTAIKDNWIYFINNNKIKRVNVNNNNIYISYDVIDLNISIIQPKLRIYDDILFILDRASKKIITYNFITNDLNIVCDIDSSITPTDIAIYSDYIYMSTLSNGILRSNINNNNCQFNSFYPLYGAAINAPQYLLIEPRTLLFIGSNLFIGDTEAYKISKIDVLDNNSPPDRIHIGLSLGPIGLTYDNEKQTLYFTELENSIAKIELNQSVLSIEDVFSKNLQIYPNPVHDFLTIKNLKSAVYYKIFDTTSRTIQSDNISNMGVIDFSNFSSGIYWLKINDVNIYKIIKK